MALCSFVARRREFAPAGESLLSVGPERSNQERGPNVHPCLRAQKPSTRCVHHSGVFNTPNRRSPDWHVNRPGIRNRAQACPLPRSRSRERMGKAQAPAQAQAQAQAQTWEMTTTTGPGLHLRPRQSTPRYATPTPTPTPTRSDARQYAAVAAHFRIPGRIHRQSGDRRFGVLRTPECLTHRVESLCVRRHGWTLGPLSWLLLSGPTERSDSPAGANTRRRISSDGGPCERSGSGRKSKPRCRRHLSQT
jgi:hypothetical protein